MWDQTECFWLLGQLLSLCKDWKVRMMSYTMCRVPHWVSWCCCWWSTSLMIRIQGVSVWGAGRELQCCDSPTLLLRIRISSTTRRKQLCLIICCCCSWSPVGKGAPPGDVTTQSTTSTPPATSTSMLKPTSPHTTKVEQHSCSAASSQHNTCVLPATRFTLSKPSKLV